jgi:hypothetical protein
MFGFCQQALTAPLPSNCPPPSDVCLEFEMFTLKALLRGCLHDVHVRYLFDTLLSKGMEIETLCSKRAVCFVGLCFVLNVGVRLVVVGKVPYTTDIVFDFLCRCIRCTGRADIQSRRIRA